MPVFTTAESDRDAIASAFSDPQALVVVSLCADWCDTCKQFRSTFENIASARPTTTFLWLDIEDDSAVAGDIDVENFPTLAVYRGATPIHFGVSLPQEGTVARLIDALAARAIPLADAPAPVLALPAAMAAD